MTVATPAQRLTSLQPDDGWQWLVPDGGWNYDLFRNLPDDGRYEVIDGRLVMSPSPDTAHQRASRNLEVLLTLWARQHDSGEVFDAPFDVVLSPQDICQPDLLFVFKARSSIISHQNIQGSPDLIVEIVSPSSVRQDRKDKKAMYERYGVAHYWVVDPHRRFLIAYRLEDGRYDETARCQQDDLFEPEGFAGLQILLEKVWE